MQYLVVALRSTYGGHYPLILAFLRLAVQAFGSDASLKLSSLGHIKRPQWPPMPPVPPVPPP